MLNCDESTAETFINTSTRKRLLFKFNLHEQYMKEEVLPIYSFLSYALMSCGLLGNGICLMVLLKGVSLQTSHFTFYRFLTAAELSYCLNYFLTVFVDTFGIEDGEYSKEYFSAFWRSYIAKFVYSSCGYMVMYMTTFISIDRSFALWMPTRYQQQCSKQRQRRVVFFCISALLISIFFHSWAAFAERQISDQIDRNGTMFYQLLKRPMERYANMLKVKDMYNGIIHLSYPLVLLILTIVVIIGFVRFQKRKEGLVGKRNNRDNRRAAEKFRERSLFYLLVIVVLLAFCQVLPTETQRVHRLICSNEYINHCTEKLHNLTISFEAGNDLVETVISRQWLQVVANLLTQIDRSMKFFLYVAFNGQFRKEAGSLLKCLRPSDGYASGFLTRIVQNFSKKTETKIGDASETLL